MQIMADLLQKAVAPVGCFLLLYDLLAEEPIKLKHLAIDRYIPPDPQQGSKTRASAPGTSMSAIGSLST